MFCFFWCFFFCCVLASIEFLTSDWKSVGNRHSVVYVTVIHVFSVFPSWFSRLVLVVLTTRRTDSVDHPSAGSALAAATFLTGWFRVRLQQFLVLCHLIHWLSHPECCFGYFVLGCLDLHMGLSATSWLRRPRPAPDPAPCVPPPSCWDAVSPRRSPVSSGPICWFQ